MLVRLNGEPHRTLIYTEEGIWLISCDGDHSPIFVSSDIFSTMERIAGGGNDTPPVLTNAESRKLEQLGELLNDARYICDEAARREKAKEIAGKYGISQKSVLRLFYRYLATGKLHKPKTTKPKANDIYDWAIKKYYYSGKRFSLRDAYEMMLVAKFVGNDGKLLSDIPTFSSFRHFFYNHGYHLARRKTISRYGIGEYQRNQRVLIGTTAEWRSEIGSFQLDETPANIYLVSRFDNRSVIGRPNIYLAVDTVSQLIAGIYVGLDAGENAFMACLANAACDKVEFCKRYDIDIDASQWPSHGVPYEIITDHGREFIGTRADELCVRYGVERHTPPSFRPDEKSLVERAFGHLQSIYEPHLRGKGIIEEDSQERWATDYRDQAVLNLTDFTKILIHSILHYNNGRSVSYRDGVNETPMTPSDIWTKMTADGKSKMLDINDKEIYQLSLPRETAVVSRKGIRHNGFDYLPTGYEKLAVGEKVIYGYDNQDISRIYIFKDNETVICKLAVQSKQYSHMTNAEQSVLKRQKSKQSKIIEREQLESKTRTIQNITSIINSAETEEKQKGQTQEIKENREKEKSKLT